MAAVGIGVNLTHHPEDTEFPATSVAQFVTPPSPVAARALLAARFAHWYDAWMNEGFEALRAAWLARPPEAVSVGEVVRFTEPDFALVECHEEGKESHCAVAPVCNLKRGFRRALDAFLRELDEMTLEEAVSTPHVAASLLGVIPIAVA